MVSTDFWSISDSLSQVVALCSVINIGKSSVYHNKGQAVWLGWHGSQRCVNKMQCLTCPVIQTNTSNSYKDWYSNAIATPSYQPISLFRWLLVVPMKNSFMRASSACREALSDALINKKKYECYFCNNTSCTRDQKQTSPHKLWAVVRSMVWRNWQLISYWYQSCLYP